jgi:hypothetical protein
VPCSLGLRYGGFETLLLSYIVRERHSNLMTDMLKTTAPRIAVVTFAIPETVTFPYVAFDMDRLKAKVVFDSA